MKQSRKNLFGFGGEGEVTYHRDVAAERRQKIAEERRRLAEQKQIQTDIQDGYAYDLGSRQKREGKPARPADALLKTPVKLLGRDKALAITRKAYMDGYRNNPAVSGPQYRLAEAVLSGTARETSMSAKAAREIVERTPPYL